MAREKFETVDDLASAGTARSPWVAPVVKRFAAGRAEQGDGSSTDGETGKS